jgi:hypothetical protein
MRREGQRGQPISVRFGHVRESSFSIRSERHAAQDCEKARKNRFLNYESLALTAELQARLYLGKLTQ